MPVTSARRADLSVRILASFVARRVLLCVLVAVGATTPSWPSAAEGPGSGPPTLARAQPWPRLSSPVPRDPQVEARIVTLVFLKVPCNLPWNRLRIGNLLVIV